MDEIRLSICIPTYNFGKFIGETLDSILSQIVEGVEIVIVDGASTDNTPQIIEAYQKKFSQIKYFPQPKKGGIDHDMALSVAFAKGNYCWLFSSDDTMTFGALEKILREIREGHDLYICGFTLNSYEMKSFGRSYPILKVRQNAVFNLSDSVERKAYFKKAIRTPAFFSFMGSLVIKREAWNRGIGFDQFMKSCWGHVARIFSLIPDGLVVKYLHESHLNKRMGNDSFMDQGLIHRLKIGVDYFQEIAHHFFGKDSFESFYIRRSIRNESFLVTLFAKAKALGDSQYPAEELEQLNQTFSKMNCDFTMFSIFYSFAYNLVTKRNYFFFRKIKIACKRILLFK